VIKQCRNLGLPEPEFVSIRGVEFRAIIARDIFTEKVLSRLGLNERQLKAVKYVKEKGRITNKEYREISGLSDEGARVDLNDLVEKGVLLPKSKGRNTNYVLK